MTASAKSTKRYYWIKLKQDFFGQKEIKKLRRLPGGDTLTIIFLKLQLLSLNDNGIIYFDGLEKRFEEEIALEIDEEPDNVRFTISYLLQIGWIEESNTDEAISYNLVKIEVGSESTSAARVRRHRANLASSKALQCNSLVTISNKNVTTEQEQETETDKEQQQEKHNPVDKCCCVVDSPKSVLQVKDLALKLQIPPATVASLIQSYGLDRFKKQLDNLQRTPNIRNNGAWLRSALEKNYELAPSLQTPVANSDCPKCHGTGEVHYAVGDTNEIISRPCSCLQRRN